VNPSVAILIIQVSYLRTWRIIRFRFDLVAVSTLQFVSNSHASFTLCMRRYKLVQPPLALTYGTTDS